MNPALFLILPAYFLGVLLGYYWGLAPAPSHKQKSPTGWSIIPVFDGENIPFINAPENCEYIDDWRPIGHTQQGLMIASCLMTNMTIEETKNISRGITYYARPYAIK